MARAVKAQGEEGSYFAFKYEGDGYVEDKDTFNTCKALYERFSSESWSANEEAPEPERSEVNGDPVDEDEIPSSPRRRIRPCRCGGGTYLHSWGYWPSHGRTAPLPVLLSGAAGPPPTGSAYHE